MTILVFSVLQGLLIATALLAGHFTLDTAKGRAALFAAMSCCGALLAFFGQRYHVGADVYPLLVSWAVLILPWVLVSRMLSAWCLWLGLLNLALLLYFGQTGFTPLNGLVASLFFIASSMAAVFWLKRERRTTHHAAEINSEPQLVDHNTVKHNRGGLILIGLMLILAVVNQAIWQKEQGLASGAHAQLPAKKPTIVPSK
ncbi:DUF2157 domain-containing protein [Glaciimonas soli]|uniref:DUF2157 domain-containing protein n=1 Tax=Glaciimonas soli TaxID=2590999 RepID=UPI002AD283D4|nr:DUF2157 domain-containing protein [Glaciimonas soli]